MKHGRAKIKQTKMDRAGISANSADLQGALTEIMAESWRFNHAMEKVLDHMDPMEAERFARQYSYFSTRVSRAAAAAGLACVDLTGQPYDAGMAVHAMNLDDFDEDESLIIVRMIEPVILCGGRVMKTGIVMLGLAESRN